MSIIVSYSGSSPFSSKVSTDPIHAFAAAGGPSPSSAVANTHIEWKETSEELVFKADLTGLQENEVNINLKEEGTILEISGEHKHENENDTYHSIELSLGNTHIEWKETPEELVFKADLPGLQEDEVNINEKEEGILEISGEHKQKNDKPHSTEISLANTHIEWKETPEELVFKADLPGLQKNEVNIKMKEEGILEISGKHKREGDKCHGIELSLEKFFRRFPLPGPVKEEEIKKEWVDGVLIVTVPKLPAP